MKRAYSQSIPFAFTVAFVVMMAGCSGQVKTEQHLWSVTEDMQKAVQSALSDLDNDISLAATKIAVTGLQGDETRLTLDSLCRKYPYIIDCSAADAKGKMITVAPEPYRRYEGIDTATNETSVKSLESLNMNRKPVLSNVFKAIEGVDAVVLVRPVVTAGGEMPGMICALFKPEDLANAVIGTTARSSGVKVNIAQTDGMTIYCSNNLETGKNLLTDPRYKGFPELITMGHKMVATSTGWYSYTFTSDTTGKPVKKTAYWATMGLHGTEWRIVSIAELGQ